MFLIVKKKYSIRLISAGKQFFNIFFYVYAFCTEVEGTVKLELLFCICSWLYEASDEPSWGLMASFKLILMNETEL